jgi:hypothetical protein
MLFVKKVNIFMKAKKIAILCSMQMLDKRIICINILIQLFVSCHISCANRITTPRYVSRSDICTTVST